ncbi:aldo-keto reductase family protein [Pseudoglutamicibacter albus]
MESARIAADVIDDAVIAARYRGGTPAQVLAAFDAGLQRYPELIQQHFGAHYGAGKVFAHMVGNPKIMRTAVRLGMGSNALMRFVVRAMGNLSDRNSPALVDRVVQALERVVPPVRNTASTPGRNSGKHSAKFSPEEVRLKVS